MTTWQNKKQNLEQEKKQETHFEPVVAAFDTVNLCTYFADFDVGVGAAAVVVGGEETYSYHV